MGRIVFGRLNRLAVVAVCVGVASSEVLLVAGGAAKTPPNVPVKVTFRNLSSPTDRLLSVGSATYTNGETGVQAYIDGSTGSIRLITCFATRPNQPCSTQGRYQFFDYQAPSNQLLPVPAATMTDPAQLSIWILDSSAASQLVGGFRSLMNYAGEWRLAGMMANYPHNNGRTITMYALRFTPNMYADSDFVKVTYLGGSLSCTTENACASWSIENYSADQDLAEFVTGDNSKDFGQFHMPFMLTVTVLPNK